MSLKDKSCVPCKGGVPPLAAEEIAPLLAELEDWRVVEDHHLEKEWRFPDFATALAFVNRAGAACEEQGHHADFELGWGRVRATLWTHKIDGLTESDFIMAARFDEI
ncbi:MAG: 4a-hydroxytetrahydrobiopterin dehydratase [Planctomycetota bacterium]